MKRFLRVVMMLFVVFAPYAFADIPTLFAQANIPFLANLGDENLLTSTFNGPAVSITAFGGDLVYDWDLNSYPGSSLTPTVQIIAFDSVQGTVTFGGGQVPIEGLAPGTPAITALGSFTLPTNGTPTFTVSVPARLSSFSGFAGGSFFQLQSPPGRLVLTFDFFPGGNGAPAIYQFSQGVFTTTPEPGSLGLMASGVAGIVGAVIRRGKLLALRKTKKKPL